MSDTKTDFSEDSAPPDDDSSIRDSLAGLVSSGRKFAEAELAWAKLKAGVVAVTLRRAAVLCALSLILMAMGVMVLIGAAIIALAPQVGLLGATLIVAGGSIVLSVLLGVTAKRAIQSLFEVEE